MSTRAWIAVLLALPLGSVVFGIGATIVLCTASLEPLAMQLLPLVAGTALVVAPLIAWYVAPLLRVRVQRSRTTKKRLADKHAAHLSARRAGRTKLTRPLSPSREWKPLRARAARH